MNGIESNGGYAIANALRINKTVQTLMIACTLTFILPLTLSSSNPNPAAVPSSNLTLTRTLLIYLILANKIGAPGAVAIAEMLKVNTTLTDLDLMCTPFTLSDPKRRLAPRSLYL